MLRTSLHPFAPALVLALLPACAGAPASGQVYQSSHHDYRVVTVAEGLDHAWGLAFLPDGDLLVTERAGRLRRISNGRVGPPLDGVPRVHATGQGGLLDVAIHPRFAQTRWVYLTFSKPGSRATTALVRGRLEAEGLTDVEEIFVADAGSGRDVHFGSRLAFDDDGLLYMTIGDRGERDAAQDRSNHQGATVRLLDDGRPAPDNPFAGRAGIRPEIFTWGHRSPQGLAIHPQTGEVWLTEHGPRGGDELNVLRAGANYGWPVITYGINYNGTSITDLREREGMEQPVHYWVPSIATSGLAIYDGPHFPEWRGDFFVGGLAGAQLVRVRVRNGATTEVEPLLASWGQRIRDVRSGPDGTLYVLVDRSRAPIVRLEPAG